MKYSAINVKTLALCDACHFVRPVGNGDGWLSSEKSFHAILCVHEFTPLFDSVFIENHPDVTCKS